MLSLLITLVLAAPVATDREAAPVEVVAPVTAEPSPRPESPPSQQPPPASDPTKFWIPAPAPAAAPPKPAPPPPPPRPDRQIRWRLDIMASVGTGLLRDPAWRAFDRDRSVVQPGLTIRGDARLGKRLFLGGGAMFRRFASKGAPYEVFNSKILVREPVAFVRLSAMMLEGIDLFAQAGGGVSILDYSFQSVQTASGRTLVPMADGVAGLALYLPRRWLDRRSAARATGGIELGAGYTWRGQARVRPNLDTADDPIEASGADLGDVGLHGFAWRLGVFLRFE